MSNSLTISYFVSPIFCASPFINSSVCQITEHRNCSAVVPADNPTLLIEFRLAHIPTLQPKFDVLP